MRTLLTLTLAMLVSLPCVGQTYTTGNGHWLCDTVTIPSRCQSGAFPVTVHGDTIKGSDRQYIYDRQEYTPSWLVLQWDAYVVECWADSERHDRTQEGFELKGTSGTWTSTIDSARVEYWSYETYNTIPRWYTTHRDPNNLTEFMAYLKRKVGAK